MLSTSMDRWAAWVPLERRNGLPQILQQTFEWKSQIAMQTSQRVSLGKIFLGHWHLPSCKCAMPSFLEMHDAWQKARLLGIAVDQVIGP
jgi:hypothetical protein